MHHCCEINNNSVSLLLPTLNPSQCLTFPIISPPHWGVSEATGSCPSCFRQWVLVHFLWPYRVGLCTWMELSNFSNKLPQAQLRLLSSLMLAMHFGSNRTRNNKGFSRQTEMRSADGRDNHVKSSSETIKVFTLPH